MKFLIIDTYYPNFLTKVRKDNADLSKKSYSYQLNYLLKLCFGTSNFYSFNLKKMGHNAIDIIANDEILQRQWAKENSLNVSKGGLLSKIQLLPFIHKLIGKPKWVQEIALAQIKKEKPDVLYMQDLSILNQQTLKLAKKYTKLLVGQIASPLPDYKNMQIFDLILTACPHFVQRFRDHGIKSEYFKIGFETRIFKMLGKLPKKYGVVFVGGISPSHRKSIGILNYVAGKVKLKIWGYGKELLLPTSKLYSIHTGKAVWGLDMYKLLAQSKIVINRHIDISENYASNMRMYEATGMGSFLLTDKKDNLNDLFVVGREVVEYENKYDLVKKIRYYLSHNKEREKIARAGQKRTFKDHSYRTRMEELVKILGKYVNKN